MHTENSADRKKPKHTSDPKVASGAPRRLRPRSTMRPRTTTARTTPDGRSRAFCWSKGAREEGQLQALSRLQRTSSWSGIDSGLEATTRGRSRARTCLSHDRTRTATIHPTRSTSSSTTGEGYSATRDARRTRTRRALRVAETPTTTASTTRPPRSRRAAGNGDGASVRTTGDLIVYRGAAAGS